MSVYLEKDFLQYIICARFVWNPRENKFFESCVELFPYSLGCRNHKNSSFFSLVIANRTLIVQYAWQDETNLIMIFLTYRRKVCQKDAKHAPV